MARYNQDFERMRDMRDPEQDAKMRRADELGLNTLHPAGDLPPFLRGPEHNSALDSIIASLTRIREAQRQSVEMLQHLDADLFGGGADAQMVGTEQGRGPSSKIGLLKHLSFEAEEQSRYIASALAELSKAL